jgi:hypothetical protein
MKRKQEREADLFRDTSVEQVVELLNGLMLGDGCIQYSGGRSKTNNSNPRLTIVRQLRDEQYNFWIYNQIKNLCNSKPFQYEVLDKRTLKIYKSSRIYSKSLTFFKEIFNYWYPDGKKRIPRNIEFTPLTLLVWFLDDGSVITANNKKGNVCKLTIKISTHGFIKEDVEFLANKLSCFFETLFRIQYDDGNHYIVGSGDAACRYIQYINDIFPDCMLRKKTWANIDFDTIKINGSSIIKKHILNYSISTFALQNDTFTTNDIVSTYNWNNSDWICPTTIIRYLTMMCKNDVLSRHFESGFGIGRKALYTTQDKRKLEKTKNEAKNYLDGYNISPFTYCF